MKYSNLARYVPGIQAVYTANLVGDYTLPIPPFTFEPEKSIDLFFGNMIKHAQKSPAFNQEVANGCRLDFVSLSFSNLNPGKNPVLSRCSQRADVVTCHV